MKSNQINTATSSDTTQSPDTGEPVSRNFGSNNQEIVPVFESNTIQNNPIQTTNNFVPKSILSVKGTRKAQRNSYTLPDSVQKDNCNNHLDSNKNTQLKRGKFFRKFSFLSKIGLNKSLNLNLVPEINVTRSCGNSDKTSSATASAHAKKQSKLSESPAPPSCLEISGQSKKEESIFTKVSFKQQQSLEKEIIIDTDNVNYNDNQLDDDNCKLSPVHDSVMNHVVESLLLNSTTDRDRRHHHRNLNPDEQDCHYHHQYQQQSFSSPITDLSSPIEPPQQFQSDSRSYCNVDVGIDDSDLYNDHYHDNSYRIEQLQSPITMYDHLNGSISISANHQHLGSCASGSGGSGSTICGAVVDEIVDDNSSQSTIIYNNNSNNNSNGNNNNNSSLNNVNCLDGSRNGSTNNSPKLNQSGQPAKRIATSCNGVSTAITQLCNSSQPALDNSNNVNNPNNNNILSFVDINDIDHNYYRLLQLHHQQQQQQQNLSLSDNIAGGSVLPSSNHHHQQQQQQPLPYSPYAAAAAAAYLRSTSHYFSNTNHNPTVIPDSQNFHQQQFLQSLPPIHHHSSAAQLLYLPSPGTAPDPVLSHTNLNRKILLNSNPPYNISQPPGTLSHKTNCVGSNFLNLTATNDSLPLTTKLPQPLPLSSSPSSVYHQSGNNQNFLCAEHKPLNGLMMDSQYCPASGDLQSGAMLYHHHSQQHAQSRKGIDPRHHHHHHHLHQFPISVNPTNRYNHQQLQQQNHLLSTSTATSGTTGLKFPLYATINSNKNRIESATIGDNNNHRSNSHLIRPNNIDFCHTANSMPIPATTAIASSSMPLSANNQRRAQQQQQLPPQSAPANLNGTGVPPASIPTSSTSNLPIENPYQRPKFNMHQSMNRDQNNNSNFDQLQQQHISEANLREMKGYEAGSQYLPLPISDKSNPYMNGANAAMFDGGFGRGPGCHASGIPRFSNDSGTATSNDKRNCSQWRMTLFVFYWIIWIVFLIGVVIIVAANARHDG